MLTAVAKVMTWTLTVDQVAKSWKKTPLSTFLRRYVSEEVNKVSRIFFMMIFLLLFFSVRQNQFDKLCNPERGWAFERVINGALDGYDHKSVDGVESRNECARLCLLETDFECRSAEYDFETKTCILSREDRRTQPEAFRNDVFGVDYIENQCAKRKLIYVLETC